MERERGRPPAGLCESCRWMRRVRSAKGSEFVRCGRSEIDASYPRYPPLPVVRCAGYEPGRPPAAR
jgi:hypothetical protein